MEFKRSYFIDAKGVKRLDLRDNMRVKNNTQFINQVNIVSILPIEINECNTLEDYIDIVNTILSLYVENCTLLYKVYHKTANKLYEETVYTVKCVRCTCIFDDLRKLVAVVSSDNRQQQQQYLCTNRPV